MVFGQRIQPLRVTQIDATAEQINATQNEHANRRLCQHHFGLVLLYTLGCIPSHATYSATWKKMR